MGPAGPLNSTPCAHDGGVRRLGRRSLAVRTGGPFGSVCAMRNDGLRTGIARGIGLALLGTVLVACGGGGGDGQVVEGTPFVKPKGGAWATLPAGPFPFGTSVLLEAPDSPVKITLPCSKGATATIELLPGARIARRADHAFDLLAGTVDVSVRKLTYKFVLFNGTSFIEASPGAERRVAFRATAAGEELDAHLIEGKVLMYATGATARELHFVDLEEGQFGWVSPGETPAKEFDEKRWGYLTPWLSVELPKEPVAASAPLRFVVTIEPGMTGSFRGLGDPEDLSNSIEVMVSERRGDKKAARSIGALVPVWDGPAPSEVVSTKDKPFRLTLEAKDHGLPAGKWMIGARYRSYREHADGSVWIGEVVGFSSDRVEISD